MRLGLAAILGLFALVGATSAQNIWASRLIPGVNWQSTTAEPLDCSSNSQCWLPTAASSDEPTTITMFGMEYCGHSRAAANKLVEIVEMFPRFRGRYIWGNQTSMVRPDYADFNPL